MFHLFCVFLEFLGGLVDQGPDLVTALALVTAVVQFRTLAQEAHATSAAKKYLYM